MQLLENNTTFYKLIIAYDGTDYSGWQAQPDNSAIANSIENTFKKVFNKELTLIGASRTDAGVHALGQVARLEIPLTLDPGYLKRVINSHLPTAIQVRSIEQVTDKFHPQRDVLFKRYYYHVFPERPLPFVARYGLYYRFPFNYTKLQDCLNIFIGTHDFRSFCTGTEMDSTIRTIDSIKVSYVKRFNVYRISVQGQSFVRYMIRRIVGASLYAAYRPDISVENLYYALEQKDPQQPYPTAPAHGLMLRTIRYREERENYETGR